MALELNLGFACEGSSDEALLGVIKTLAINSGATRVTGDAFNMRGTVRKKIEFMMNQTADYDILFIHRDADDSDPQPRYEEIQQAGLDSSWDGPLVGVVPVQMTEAWLLTDHQAIRDVAGKSRGRVGLHLPGVNRIEDTHDPKSVLLDAYLSASEATGRRRKDVIKRFSARRRTLLERLDPDGDVSALRSFVRMREDIHQAVRKCAAVRN